MMTVPEIFGASKKLVTGPNGIMVAQTFCDILFYEKKTSDINI
jgi:MFS superfamily sulfate permease-like transporter